MVKKDVYLYESDKVLYCNIWVTLYCNFKCNYCYESPNKPSSFMQENIADQAVKFIINMFNKENYTALWLNFHGGEPMLNTKIIKHIINKVNCYDVKLYTSMTTNCSIWDEEISDYINELTVSIDGNKEIHDLNRIYNDGGGTYDIAKKNAMKYLDINDGVRLRMVVSPNTVHGFFDGVRHLAELGFKEIIPGVDYFNANWNDVLFDELYKQYILIDEWRKHNCSDLVIGKLDEGHVKKGKCRVGCDGYQINVDGLIYPCTYVVGKNEFCIGNVYSGLDNKLIDKFNEINCGKISACEGCNNYEYCISPRCLMLNYLLTGDYYTPSGIVCADENLKLKLQKLV